MEAGTDCPPSQQSWGKGYIELPFVCLSVRPSVIVTLWPVLNDLRPGWSSLHWVENYP